MSLGCWASLGFYPNLATAGSRAQGRLLGVCVSTTTRLGYVTTEVCRDGTDSKGRGVGKEKYLSGKTC